MSAKEAASRPGMSRRSLLGGAVAAGLANAGIGQVGTARAASALVTQGASGPAAVSPDGRARIGVSASAGVLNWTVSYDGRPVIRTSPLGLTLSDGTVLGSGVRVTGTSERVMTGSWQPLYGRQAEVSAACRELTLDVVDTATGIAFSVVARAYDAGVALRYVLRGASGMSSLTIAGENTTYGFPSGTVIYANRDESPFTRSAAEQLLESGSSGLDVGRLADQPLTASLASGSAVCLCEANRVHYPRLMLEGSDTPDQLTAYLMRHAGRGNTPEAPTFEVDLPFETPWRVLVIGETPAAMVDHADLVPTLADPSPATDTSWIRPGKAIRVTSLNTAAALACVDFAVERDLRYIEFDAGWYGPETNPSSDPTKPIAGLDMPQVISYGAGKGVGVVLYVNQIALTDTASLFATYQSWGVAGLKLGFILDGTQAETDWILTTVRQAATYKLMLNLHDDLRPFGQERTYPHWINMEGVRGNEHFPTATHNVTLPFTRNIGGPMDYTICLAQPRDLTTNAHQLAIAVVFYQPLAWFYWYDSPSKYATGSWPELAWFDAVPTVWDESRTLAGAIGEYIVMARRRGSNWYLGAMTNEQTRIIDVPLDFLGSGSWQATLFTDANAANPADIPEQTGITVTNQTVTSGTTLRLALAEAGGAAVLLTGP